MPNVEFELTIQASEREKSVHALDYSATVTGMFDFTAFQKHKSDSACSVFFSDSGRCTVDQEIPNY
jgi:hypothetical protein